MVRQVTAPTSSSAPATRNAAYPNVLLLRTLSKGYSLAGLRLAYGLGAKELVAPMLSKIKDSYNVDAIAQAVGTAALEDVGSAAGSWEAVRHERRALDLALTAIGLPCSPSQANFLLATVPAGGRWHSAEKAYRSPMARRIFVRWFNEEGLRDKLRISIGTPEENRQLGSSPAAWRIEVDFKTICTQGPNRSTMPSSQGPNATVTPPPT